MRVSFAELLDEVRARGLARLPPFLCVTLVKEACATLGRDRGPLEPNSLSLDETGTVHSMCRGDDVGRELADILEAFLAGHDDPELARLLDDARSDGVETAKAFGQRLSHWLVKQRQAQPKGNLCAELSAWLRPDDAAAAASAEFVQWLETERDASLEPPPSPAEPDQGSLRNVLLGMAAVLAVGVVGVGIFLTEHEAPEEAKPLELPRLARPPPLPPAQKAAAAAEPVIQPLAAPEEPKLPRLGRGVPAMMVLSSQVHGLDMTTAGVELTAPSAQWALKTVPLRAKDKPPPYAWLYVATLDAQHAFTSLSLVGPDSWKTLTTPFARVFLVQPDLPPDDDSFALALAVVGAKVFERPELRRPSVLGESMAQQEGRRYVLEGLDPERDYDVSVRRGATAKIVATVTTPRARVRTMLGHGFVAKAHPLDQMLLQPGSATRIKGVTRLSFVVLTSPGAPETQGIVEVQEVIPVARGLGAIRGAPRSIDAVDTRESLSSLQEQGRYLLLHDDIESALPFIERCLALDASNQVCLEQKRRAALMKAK